jgi:iron complex outermembrane receptor protein
VVDAADSWQELSRMSLADLTHVDLISVSKCQQTLNTAAAAIFVITRDDILRSGAHSIPEALRLAPNVQVSQLTASSYAITARGFVGNPPDQNFSNKLLILIDGRSVYSPLYSGVSYDQVDVMLEDVDRIEVISGPGATLWGANAVNGVINIITRSSSETEGVFVGAGAGNQGQNLAARYGGQVAGGASYRIYGTGFERSSLELADGAGAHNHWNRGQVGFRTDWSQGQDGFTVQGDAYRGNEDQTTAGQIPICGANLLARWQHSTERSSLQLQAYLDHSEAGRPVDGVGFVLNTYDIELQQSLTPASGIQLVWGAGERLTSYHIDNSATLYFDPSHRWLQLGNLFVQGTFALGAGVDLTAGLKLEDDPYSRWTAMPDVRLSWMTHQDTFLWLAASQAARSPTPFDVDVREKAGTTLFLTGNSAFRTEKVTAYEAGYRRQFGMRLSLSATAFYNVYDELRTIEPAPVVFLPLRWDNLMKGDTYGAEVWGDIQLMPWWRLSPGFRSFRERLRFKAGASGLLGLAQAGDDPRWQASLKSAMDFGSRATFDLFLRHVDPLPDPYSPGYYELNARLALRATGTFEVALVGNNLLHDRHQEFPVPAGEFIPRSLMAEVRWRP